MHFSSRSSRNTEIQAEVVRKEILGELELELDFGETKRAKKHATIEGTDMVYARHILEARICNKLD